MMSHIHHARALEERSLVAVIPLDMSSLALVQVTVLPSTVLDPECWVTVPGKVTDTLKSLSISGVIS